MSILPFIMLGVGVDGMFVLQSALEATDRELSMVDRMQETMRTGGLSVAVASLTNFGAFMIGSNTSLPALSAFSVYAAMGLLFNLLLQVRCMHACPLMRSQRSLIVFNRWIHQRGTAHSGIWHELHLFPVNCGDGFRGHVL